MVFDKATTHKHPPKFKGMHHKHRSSLIRLQTAERKLLTVSIDITSGDILQLARFEKEHNRNQQAFVLPKS